MSSKKIETRTSRKAGKPSHRVANGYIHVAKPATASEILRDLGISQAQVKRLLQGLKFTGSHS
jgi:DNA-binding transcriptional regulator LsrR (DeoR family)